MKAEQMLSRLRRAWHSMAVMQWSVLSVLLVVALASSLTATLLCGETWGGLLLNFGTEMAGAVVTYALLQMIIGARARKEDLIAQMGSDVRDVAVPAVDELRRHGWLTDGSLRKADRRGANLQDADLLGANLLEAILWRANLQGAFLEGADLARANLQGANLCYANLPGVELSGANLQGAGLRSTDLSTARNLETAKLDGAIADSSTQWPEGFSPREAGVVMVDWWTEPFSPSEAGVVMVED